MTTNYGTLKFLKSREVAKMRDFFGIFRKRNVKKGAAVERQVGNLSFTILPTGTITTISEEEVSNIVKITQEELKRGMKNIGYNIAVRIVEESLNPEFCAAYVDGGNDGTKWLIKLSNNPLEFID